jgi:hypothetical protein
VKKLISKEEAAELLQSHVALLHDCVARAWKEWCGLRDREAHAGIQLGPIARARIVYELIVRCARVAFSDVRGVSVSQKRGFLVLVFDDQAVVRFKKLKKSLLPSSARTRQQELFAAQQELPGFPPPATYLNAGYVLDETQLEITRIVLSCVEGKELRWWLDLDVGLVGASVPLAAAAPLPAPIVRSRAETRRTDEGAQ